MFSTVFIANRGEISLRIQRTLRALGIRSAVGYSDADCAARHVVEADAAVRLGPAAPRESYLHVERVIEAAQRTGADALHPGYGFLAESDALAQACLDAGIAFIGPAPAAIRAMGDKIRARELVAAVGVPVVPGRGVQGMTDDEIAAVALEVGFPIMLKPSAGGGGKGMRVVTGSESLLAEIGASRREARAAFGDDTLLVERYIDAPRHIEFQIAADVHGGVVHLGERECSLQRRSQKIIEEAPSPFLDPDTRAAMGAQAVAVARACDYTNIGTVEFIVPGDNPTGFFFIEMNTRLQVEHAVTEEIYEIDLVELQLRLAAGHRLPWRQAELVPTGRHSIEARIYAEDPGHGFLPTGGTVLHARVPSGPCIRVESALVVGGDVSSLYDPMLAKVVAVGATRGEAIERLDWALRGTTILGMQTNVGYLQDLLAQPEVLAGDLDTNLAERVVPSEVDVPDDAIVTAALIALLRDTTDGVWSEPFAWRIGGNAWIAESVHAGNRRAHVRVRRQGDGWLAAVDGATPRYVELALEPTRAMLQWQDRTCFVDWALADDETVWVGWDGRAFSVTPLDPLLEAATSGAAESDGIVVSPMPGSVVAVLVEVGQSVTTGTPLAVVEAMKMEHTLTAPIDGTVSRVHVQVGDSVGLKHPVVIVEPS